MIVSMYPPDHLHFPALSIIIDAYIHIFITHDEGNIIRKHLRILCN